MSFTDTIKKALGEHKEEDVKFFYNNYNYDRLQILDEILKTDKITEDQKQSLEKYTSLVLLTINDVGLSSLENFPHLNELKIVRKTIYLFL